MYTYHSFSTYQTIPKGVPEDYLRVVPKSSNIMHVHVRNLKLNNDIRGVPYVKLIKFQILDLRSMKNSTFRKHRMVLVCWKCVYSIRFPAVYRRKYRYARTTKLHWFTYANHDELLTMHVPNVPLRLRLIETHVSSDVRTYLY